MKRHAPATSRNAEPLAEVLAEELPRGARVLEVASGTGEHALFMARRFPAFEWQPSDVSSDARQSIESWREEAGLANLHPPIALDAASDDWGVDAIDAIVCVNMVHISPWDATQGLFRGAARHLPRGGPLVIYGPFLEADVETAPSNLAFDESLRLRDPEWGLRQVAALDALAEEAGLERSKRHQMPANNITLVYRKT